MNGQRRVSAAVIEELAEQLTDRDRSILRSLAACRVLTGHQLTRLHFTDLSPHTQDRVRRRVLERLHGLRLVARLDRTVGGIRAGSTGWIFTLGLAGQKLVQHELSPGDGRRARHPWTPSALFMRHSLDVAEIYVQLHEAARRTYNLDVTQFVTEPACWWPDGLGGWVKPDALVTLHTAAYDEIVWLEVDRGTESLPTLTRKLDVYADFVRRGQIGPDDVLPHVVITVTTEQRRRDVEIIADRTDAPSPLFTVCTFTDATETLVRLALDDKATEFT